MSSLAAGPVVQRVLPDLPDEVVLHACGYLDAQSLRQLASTSRDARETVKAEVVRVLKEELKSLQDKSLLVREIAGTLTWRDFVSPERRIVSALCLMAFDQQISSTTIPRRLVHLRPLVHNVLNTSFRTRVLFREADYARFSREIDRIFRELFEQKRFSEASKVASLMTDWRDQARARRMLANQCRSL